MRCKIILTEFPNYISKDKLNVYRVIFDDKGIHIRLDLEGTPQYFSIIDSNLIVYSKKLYEILKGIDFDSCELNKIIEGILNEVVYLLGINRTKLFEKFDTVLYNITEGKFKDIKQIKDLRKAIQNLYLDYSSLYYLCKKLSKYISQEIKDEVEFAYERAEILLTRSSDIYNIYLTEVQNELNNIIKKLTSISFIFLPITAIASIYAVTYATLPSNFSSIESLYFLLPLVFLGIILTIYLRKIKWL